MLKLIGSFVAGVAAALAFCWFAVYPDVAREKYAFGHDQGYQTAQIDIAHKIRETLGDDYKRGEAAQSFYGVKDVAVLVVTRENAKTLRLYRE